MRHIQALLLAASVVIAGCKTAIVPTPVFQPAATTGSNDTSTKSIGPWVLIPSRQSHTYHSISRTTVHEPSDLTTRQGKIEIVTDFTISLDQTHTPLIISGHVDTINFHSQNQTLPENRITLPLLFEGELSAKALTINAKSSQIIDGICSPSISSILGDLRTVITAFPSPLTPNLTWKDSTLATTCTTGGIPTMRKTIQQFRVVGERALSITKAILLQRLDSTYISGDGTQGNHQIHLEGVGTGTANIYINPTTAAMLVAELSEKLEITVTNSGKTRHFIQEVTQKLETTN